MAKLLCFKAVDKGTKGSDLSTTNKKTKLSYALDPEIIINSSYSQKANGPVEQTKQTLVKHRR